MDYKASLKGGSNGKSLDLVSLKLTTALACGDPKVLIDAIKSYPEAEDVNIRDCALKGSKLFGPNKRKLNMPHGVKCGSHQPEGGFVPLPQVFNNCNPPYLLIASWATKPERPPYIQVWEDNVSQFNNIDNGSQKQMR